MGNIEKSWNLKTYNYSLERIKHYNFSDDTKSYLINVGLTKITEYGDIYFVPDTKNDYLMILNHINQFIIIGSSIIDQKGSLKICIEETTNYIYNVSQKGYGYFVNSNVSHFGIFQIHVYNFHKQCESLIKEFKKENIYLKDLAELIHSKISTLKKQLGTFDPSAFADQSSYWNEVFLGFYISMGDYISIR